MSAVAVPEGNFNFSLTITSFLRGTANTTPKKHIPNAHSTSLPVGSLKPPVSADTASAATTSGSSEPDCGVSLGLSKNSSAGTTPTKPQPSGIVPTLPATVCTSTFSTSLKPSPNPYLVNPSPRLLMRVRRPLKYAKPTRAEGMAMPEIHPVCKPK
jgi:hypothetical protein